MSVKLVQVHTAATRELANKIAEELRDKSMPCTNPYVTDENFWQVDQYVRTSYPEI